MIRCLAVRKALPTARDCRRARDNLLDSGSVPVISKNLPYKFNVPHMPLAPRAPRGSTLNLMQCHSPQRVTLLRSTPVSIFMSNRAKASLNCKGRLANYRLSTGSHPPRSGSPFAAAISGTRHTHRAQRIIFYPLIYTKEPHLTDAESLRLLFTPVVAYATHRELEQPHRTASHKCTALYTLDRLPSSAICYQPLPQQETVGILTNMGTPRITHNSSTGYLTGISSILYLSVYDKGHLGDQLQHHLRRITLSCTRMRHFRQARGILQVSLPTNIPYILFSIA